MTEKFQLPNPTPKGTEHEKWKAMVDSVIEFISASRTMLHVLNERVKDSERFKEEEKKKHEDEKTKLAFYKDCLHLEIKPRLESKPATTATVKEGGDALNGKTCPFHHRVEPVKDNGDKASNPPVDTKTCCNTGKTSSVSGEIKSVNDNKETAKTPVTPTVPKDSSNMAKNDTDINSTKLPEVQSYHSHSHINEKLCTFHRKVDSAKNSECKLSKVSQEVQHSPVEHVSKEIQYTSVDDNVKKPSSTSKDTRPLATGQNDAKTLPPSCRKIPSFQSGSSLPKCQKFSRIPRTKSCTDDKTKSVVIDKTPNEGYNIAKPHCTKKCLKESTYSTIHQRTKTPKGGSITQL